MITWLVALATDAIVLASAREWRASVQDASLSLAPASYTLEKGGRRRSIIKIYRNKCRGYMIVSLTLLVIILLQQKRFVMLSVSNIIVGTFSASTLKTLKIYIPIFTVRKRRIKCDFSTSRMFDMYSYAK